MARTAAGRVGEMKPGEKRLVSIGRRSVVLACVSAGRYLAVSNTCPHEGAELIGGVVSGTTVQGRVGEYIYARDNEIIVCPWHRYEFDMVSGCSLVADDRYRIKTYETAVEDGVVYIDDGLAETHP